MELKQFIKGGNMNATTHKTESFFGVRFWTGNATDLIKEADRHGGLFSVPSAPSLAEMGSDDFLRRAYQGSDWAVVDGGYVALILRFIFRRPIPRISGLQILQKLLGFECERVMPLEDRRVLWVMPSSEEGERVGKLAVQLGLAAENQQFYTAPYYQKDEDYWDADLVREVNEFRPDWIILGIGGGRQEKLGLCLRNELKAGMRSLPDEAQGRLPVILCTGGAIAFLTGGQVQIPDWADRLYLGWLLRICHDPRRFVGRYWKAAWSLPLILWRYRDNLFETAPETGVAEEAVD